MASTVYDDQGQPQDPFGNGGEHDTTPGYLKSSEERAAPGNTSAENAFGDNRDTNSSGAFGRDGDKAEDAFGGNDSDTGNAFGRDGRDDSNALQKNSDNSDAKSSFGGDGDVQSGKDAFGQDSDTLDNNSAKNAFGQTRNRFQNLRSSALNNKRLVGIVGGSAVIGLIILLLILISALEIPDLAQNITSYEFARVTRQFSQSAERITDEELALEATDTGAKNSFYNTLRNKYSGAAGKVSDTWSKLDNYRPQKVIQNLGENNGLQLRFQDDQFIGGTLDGVEFSIEKQGLTRFVPGLSSIISFKNNINFSSDFAPALEASLKANDVGPIIRGVVANDLRKELNISLIAWYVGKYQGKNAEQARIIEEDEKVAATDGTEPKVVEGSVAADNAAEEAGAQAKAEALSTTSGTEEIINNGGIVQAAKTAIGNSLANTPLKDVISIANPVAAAVTPLCIVYDGSLDKSGPVIDNQTRQQQAAYYYIASAGDQQKAGSDPEKDPSGTGLVRAIGATNDDVGNIAQSNAIIRADGGTVDTSSSVSAEASADGQFTLFNALGLPSAATTFFNAAAGTVCPVITNTAVQIGLGVANVAAQLIPGVDASVDAGDAGAEATSEATGVFVREQSQNLVEKLVSKALPGKAGSLVNRTGHMLFDTAKNAGEIAGATVLAKLIVLSRAGLVDSGTAQGTDLTNEADSGGNIQASELERTQLFGRPLLQSEICTSNQDDQAFLSNQAGQESTFSRYLSVDNAGSLLSRVGILTDGDLSGSLANYIMHLGSEILRPTTLISSLTTLFWGHVVAAGCGNDNSTDYGNVQFGWSDDEENLIDSSDTYRSSLENQAILDNSTNGGETAIAQKYAVCFGYTYNASGDGSFDPTDPNGYLQLASGPGQPGSLGTLLSSGDIMRDSNGNVVNDPSALCSPINLSYNNDTYGPQMVFRWRLAMQYDTTIDQFINEQTLTNSTGTVE